jgi:hypothetical protein
MMMHLEKCFFLLLLSAFVTIGLSQSNRTAAPNNSTFVPTEFTSTATSLETQSSTTRIPTNESTTTPTNAANTTTPTNAANTTAPSEPVPEEETSPPSDAKTTAPSEPVGTPTDPPSDEGSENPTGAPPTERPSPSPIILFDPTKRPSQSPSSRPSQTKSKAPTSLPTAEPSEGRSLKPTARPTVKGTTQRFKIPGITLTFNDVTELSSTEISIFEEITKDWFEEYFNNRTTGRRMIGRSLQGSGDIRNMDTTIKVINQALDTLGNTIRYNQSLVYIATANAQSADELIVQPFQDNFANADYASRLSINLDAFRRVGSPIAVPVVKEEKAPEAEENDGLSLYAIIGIAVGGTVFCALLLFLAIRSMGSDKDATGYVDSGSLPPTQFNINAAEEVSVIEDPTVAKMGSGNMSLGQYGDQRQEIDMMVAMISSRTNTFLFLLHTYFAVLRQSITIIRKHMEGVAMLLLFLPLEGL